MAVFSDMFSQVAWAYAAELQARQKREHASPGAIPVPVDESFGLLNSLPILTAYFEGARAAGAVDPMTVLPYLDAIAESSNGPGVAATQAGKLVVALDAQLKAHPAQARALATRYADDIDAWYHKRVSNGADAQAVLVKYADRIRPHQDRV
jgi:hypothetical protein